MSAGNELAAIILGEIMLAQPLPLADTLSAVVSCLITTINDIPDEDVRARVAITALQGIISNVDAPRAALAAAAKEIALSDVVGTA